MPVHQFRFEILSIPLLMWLLSWGSAVGVYLGLVWPNGASPGWWWPQVPTVVFVSLGCIVACTLKHWRRMLDRSPQLELYANCLRAKQLGDVEILWTDVRNISAVDKIGGAMELGMNAKNNLLTFDVAGMGEVEVDVDGLGLPAGHILKLIVGMRPEFKRM